MRNVWGAPSSRRGPQVHDGGPNLPVIWGRGGPNRMGAPKFYDTVTPSIKRAISAEVRRRFFAPKFQMPNISAIGAWSEIYPMPFWIDLNETRRFN